MQRSAATPARLLATADCEACGAPVLDPDASQPGRWCSQVCGAWSRTNPGRRRERPPCEECGETIHYGWSIEGRWCSLRCRDRALAPPAPDGPPAPPGAWARDAACLGVDVETFYPERGNAYRTMLSAKAVCAGCPVRDECLDYALTLEGGRSRETFGVWGGMSPSERVALAREREAGEAVDRMRRVLAAAS